MKKKAYVIGEKVKNSLSPNIFNYWFNKHNINGEYLFREIKKNNFEKEINKILMEPDVCGANITIPFKESIIQKINSTDLHSKNIGAVNCLYKTKDNWFGINTDWSGFLESVKKSKFNLKNKKAIVVGYGGAAKAIIYALKKDGFNEIKVFNRSIDKIEHLKKNKTTIPMQINCLPEHLSGDCLVINTIPVSILESFQKIKNTSNSWGFDAVYRPKETQFLSHFNKNRRIYGISMLINQAIPCFEKWYGVRPNIDSDLLLMLEKEIR